MPHHPVFSRFTRWEGVVEPGWNVDWLGVRTRASFARWDSPTEPTVWRPSLPPIDREEYAEWLAVLAAVEEAGELFTMVELGAGFGRWIVSGAAAYRQLHPDGRLLLVAVEADPAHFSMIDEHMRANGLDPSEHRLVDAAVAGRPGSVRFTVGDDPNGWWGQSIQGGRARIRQLLRPRPARSVHTVTAVTLDQLLADVPGVVDLIDLDVQGAEADVLEPATSLERVRRVHVETHNRGVEGRLRRLFRRLGWECVNDYPIGAAADTTWGARVMFTEGLQTWVNPSLHLPRQR